jgi:competence protein ComEA
MISIRNFIALLAAVFAFQAFAAVNVNQASQAELETVKGIGPGLSGKILKARQTGEFKSWGDLVERVSGIGAGNAARFSKAGLTVSGAPYEGQATPASEGNTAKKSSRNAKAEGAEPAAKKSKKADKPEA